MRSLVKSLILTALCFTTITIANVSLANVSCEGNTCNFSNLTTQEDQNHFYCKVEGDINHILLENHNLLATGFNKEGKLQRDGKDVKDFQTFFLDAKRDDSDSGRVVITEVTGTGKFTCQPGDGGRTDKFPGGYHKGQ